MGRQRMGGEGGHVPLSTEQVILTFFEISAASAAWAEKGVHNHTVVPSLDPPLPLLNFSNGCIFTSEVPQASKALLQYIQNCFNQTAIVSLGILLPKFLEESLVSQNSKRNKRCTKQQSLLSLRSSTALNSFM